MTLQGKLNGHDVHMLLDSGAEGNFISRRYITKQQHGVHTQQKHEPYVLSDVEGTPLSTGEFTGQGNVHHETFGQKLNLAGHLEDIILDVIPIQNYDVILGIP